MDQRDSQRRWSISYSKYLGEGGSSMKSRA